MAQRCTVCAHPRRAQIDVALGSKHNATEMARDLGVTRFAVAYHRRHHLAREEVEETEHASEGFETPSTRAKLDPKTAFLTAYAASADIKAGLKAAGITRVKLRQWQEHDPEFSSRFYQAETEAVESLEAEARIRAIAGSKLVRRVFRHGMLYEEIHEYRPSDTMLTKLLQAARPEKYTDRLTLTQTSVIKAVDADAWNAV
jgi:hypothetical protein